MVLRTFLILISYIHETQFQKGTVARLVYNQLCYSLFFCVPSNVLEPTNRYLKRSKAIAKPLAVTIKRVNETKEAG